MDIQIVFVYCLCDDLLKALQHGEDPQCWVSDAEILTVALVAALYFDGHFKRANEFLHEQGYLPRRLSASRFSRRVHRCAPFVLPLFHGLAGLGHQLNPESVYLIDSFPIAACDNIRIPRCRRYRGEAWRGYQASKRRSFYGLKIHLLVTAHGLPVEFFLTPGADSDTKALKQYAFDLPKNATITGDKAYPVVTYLMATARKAVETTGSLIERLLPKHIHTVTAAGFELKVALFILACSLNFVF